MLFTLLLVSSCLSLALAGDYCYASDGYTSTVNYCTYGCCDTNDVYDPCCSIPSGTVVGIVIGVVVVVVIICVVVFLVVRRRRQTIIQHTTQGVVGGPQIITTQTNQSAMGQTGPYIQAPGYGPPPQDYYPQVPPTQPPQYAK